MDDGTDELLEKLKLFGSDAKVDHQSAIAQKFRRETDKKDRGGSRAEREAFQRKWAQVTYAKTLETKTETQTSLDEDLAAGNYEPFDIVLENEVGGKSKWNWTQRPTTAGNACTTEEMDPLEQIHEACRVPLYKDRHEAVLAT